MKNQFSDLHLLSEDGTVQFRNFVLKLLGDSKIIGGDMKPFSKVSSNKVIANEIVQQSHGYSYYADFYLTIETKDGTAVLINFRKPVHDQQTFNKIARILERIKTLTNSSMIISPKNKNSKKKGK